jgi:hypothetical protein
MKKDQPMCHYQTLYHDADKGYVVHCLLCDHLQVAFGNVALTLCRDEFYWFQHSMNLLHGDLTRENKTSAQKNITVPTPCDGIMLLLTYKELETLNHMLDAAETELKSQQLLSLFGDNNS